MTPLDWVKVVVNTFWLLPLRLVLFVVPSFCLGVCLCTLSILGDSLDEKNPRPLRGWRRFLVNDIGTRVARVLLFGCGFHWVRVRGKPATAAEAPIIVASPHASVLDVFIISLFNLPTFVAKSEARSVPILGYLVTHALRAIYVARDDPASRRECTDEILRRVQDSAAGWPKILIFPEATTHSTEVLLEYKKGAFLPSVPVQAVAIKYQNRSNTMVWSDRGTGLITSLYLTLCQFHNSLEVEFLPVHHTTPEEAANPEVFAENVRKEVSRATGIPTSHYSVEDLLMCRKAEQLGLPFHSGLISFPCLNREFQLGLRQAKYWLERFSEMDRDKDGFITSEDFCHYLAVPTDACSLAVFSALRNKASEGGLDFRHYLYGVLRMSLPFTADEKLLEMFQFFDRENKGQITLSDISSRLPVQWTRNSEHYTGNPPPRQRGYDLCGCGRQQLPRRLNRAPQQASLPESMDYGTQSVMRRSPHIWCPYNIPPQMSSAQL
jgi:lysophosphatidylcholine acyltransferase/lyso-PAF acetyltransferase